jgi:hypothetical protein
MKLKETLQDLRHKVTDKSSKKKEFTPTEDRGQKKLYMCENWVMS